MTCKKYLYALVAIASARLSFLRDQALELLHRMLVLDVLMAFLAQIEVVARVAVEFSHIVALVTIGRLLGAVILVQRVAETECGISASFKFLTLAIDLRRIENCFKDRNNRQKELNVMLPSLKFSADTMLRLSQSGRSAEACFRV